MTNTWGVIASGQKLLHEVTVLAQMLDGEGMVRAWPLEYLLKVVRSALRGLPATLLVGDGHERALAPLLVLLLIRAVGDTFTTSSSRFVLPLGRSKIAPTASLPKAWLVAMSRSSLVVHGPLRPSL